MESDEEEGERGGQAEGKRELRAPCSALMNIFIGESHECTPTRMGFPSASPRPFYSVCTALHAGRTRNKLTSNAVHGAR